MRNGRERKVGAWRRVMMEGLEGRVMLNGVTVITHGLELTTGMPGWVKDMGAGVAADAGAGTAVYRMTVGADGSGAPAVTNFVLQSGFAVGDGRNVNGEAVVEVDWSADSGVNGRLKALFSTKGLGALMTNYLLGNEGVLFEGAIHLVGHSRGASLMSEMAKDLGKAGLWVDQLTTLDPHPVSPDPGVSVGSNVVFADNYYEKQDLTTHGRTVGGALNFGALKLSGGYAGGILGGLLPGAYHDNVYLYYYGTVNVGSGAKADGQSIPNGWYATNGAVRGTTGFYYSAVEGGVRPVKEVGKAFGGKGGGGSVAVGSGWADVEIGSVTTHTVGAGQVFGADVFYQSVSVGSEVTYFMDTDQNPYDGNETMLGEVMEVKKTGKKVAKLETDLDAPAVAGSYYLGVKISDGGETRYAYEAGVVTVV